MSDKILLTSVCLILSTLSNYSGLFYSLFWIELKQSVGVKVTTVASSIYCFWIELKRLLNGERLNLYHFSFLFYRSDSSPESSAPLVTSDLGMSLRSQTTRRESMASLNKSVLSTDSGRSVASIPRKFQYTTFELEINYLKKNRRNYKTRNFNYINIWY